MQPVRLSIAIALLAGLGACGNDTSPSPPQISQGPLTLPGERAADRSLVAPPDEWVGPRRAAQALRSD